MIPDKMNCEWEQVLELNTIPYGKCDSPSHFIWVYHRIYIWTCYLGHFRESGSSKMSNKAIIPWLYFSINTNDSFIAIGGQPHLSKLCAGGIWVVLRFVMSPLIKLTTLNWWYWLVDAGTEFLIFMEDSDSLQFLSLNHFFDLSYSLSVHLSFLERNKCFRCGPLMNK